MSNSYDAVSQGSVGRIMWCVAIDQPVTMGEIADRLGAEKSTISTALTRLWRAELLIRRKHPEFEGAGAKTPYQYAIRVPEDSNE